MEHLKQIFILLGDSEFMLSFYQHIFKRNMRKNDEEVLNEQSREVSTQQVDIRSLQNSYANAGALHLEKATSLDIIEVGYGKAGKLQGRLRGSPYDRNDYSNKTLEEVLNSRLHFCQGKGTKETGINTNFFTVGSIEEEEKCKVQQCEQRDFITPMVKQRDPITAMLQIARNNRTESQGDVQEILKQRAEAYGHNLDPKWFTYDIDLGTKVKSMQERNTARAMLAGAPLMVAQLGALEFRKRMLKGDAGILSSLRMGDTMTISQVLKKLGALPPLTLLKLCNKELGDFVMDSLIQHSDDLDFVQDVLNTTASHSSLTPTMHAVIAGFTRRRNYGRFKHNQQSVALDRVRFAHLASPKDNDDTNIVKRNRRIMGGDSKIVCKFFQRRRGCSKAFCPFVHKCNICQAISHGGFNCTDRLQGNARPQDGRKDLARVRKKRWNSVPTEHRRRRSR